MRIHRLFCVARHGPCEVWAKPMEDGSLAVGLFNRGDVPATVAAQWVDLQVTGRREVRDLWRQEDLGVFDGMLTSLVNPHGVRMIRLWSE